jgi:RNA recognition motif-containing protein
VRLMKDKYSGKSKGFAFADFVAKDAAEQLVRSMQNCEMDGRPLRVNLATPSTDKKAPPECSVFVANLNFDTTKDAVIELVNTRLGQGKVSKVRMSIDKLSGRPRGYGYIDFIDADTANKAMTALQGAELDGRTLRIDLPRRLSDGGEGVYGSADAGPRFRNSDQEPKPYSRESRPNDADLPSLYLGNLSFDVTLDVLKAMLDDLLGSGKHVSVKLPIDRITGRPRGFAHVTFADAASAEMAKKELQGVTLLDRNLRVDDSVRKELGGAGGGYEGGRQRR